MSDTFSITEDAQHVYGYIHLPSTQASTFHSDHLILDPKRAGAEANSVIREAHMSYLNATIAAELDADWTEEEEREWDTLFAQPHVQAGLDRLAKEAERQIAAGEIEEGGFAVE